MSEINPEVDPKVFALERFKICNEMKNFKRCSKGTINSIIEEFIPSHTVVFNSNKEISLYFNQMLKLREKSNTAFMKKLLNYINELLEFNLPKIRHIKNKRNKKKIVEIETKGNPCTITVQNQNIGSLPIESFFVIKWKEQNDLETLTGTSLENALSKAGYDLEMLNEIENVENHPISIHLNIPRKNKLKIKLKNGDVTYPHIDSIEKVMQEFNIKFEDVALVKPMNEYNQEIDSSEFFNLNDFRNEILNIEEYFSKKVELLKIKYMNIIDIKNDNMKINFTII